MVKKACVIIIVFLITAISINAASKPIPLPDVVNPKALYFDDKQMYIVEGTTIYIYSLADFKLIRKFGKKGEGPEEFLLDPSMMGMVFIDVSTDEILVTSMGKLSFWTKDGKFKKEKKFGNPQTRSVLPFGKNYVGKAAVFTDKIYEALYLLNPELKQTKELAKVENAYQQGKGLMVLKSMPHQEVYKDKLYIAWENDFKIRVLDTGLKEEKVITHDIERVKVTAKDKKIIIHYLKTSPELKDHFQALQPIRFPELFPSILGLTISGDIIYILTFKTEDKGDIQNFEFLLFDINGKFRKSLLKPVRMMTPLLPYPYKIHKGKFYQMVDNEEKEQWELFITGLD